MILVLMKNESSGKFPPANRTGSAGAMAQLRWLVLVGVILLAAAGWFYGRMNKHKPRLVESPAASESGGILSETTTRILAGLEKPIDLRLFAPADVRGLPADLGGYVSRVENFLAEYELAAAGKLRVVKSDPQVDAAAKAAAGAAGVVPFASENGEIVYLGLTVGNGARIEAIAPLAPEWEAALESDVSRAILRVATKLAAPVKSVAQTPAPPAPIDPVISEELLRTFPNLASQPFEATANILREQALEEFKTATVEMQSKVTAAQQALAEAQANKSAAAQQSARQAFQKVQAEQADKLKAITARLQERITVLERLKTGSQSSSAALQP
jgi:hypothetical protein